MTLDDSVVFADIISTLPQKAAGRKADALLHSSKQEQALYSVFQSLPFYKTAWLSISILRYTRGAEIDVVIPTSSDLSFFAFLLAFLFPRCK